MVIIAASLVAIAVTVVRSNCAADGFPCHGQAIRQYDHVGDILTLSPMKTVAPTTGMLVLLSIALIWSLTEDVRASL